MAHIDTSIRTLGAASYASPLQAEHAGCGWKGPFVGDGVRVRQGTEVVEGDELGEGLTFEKAGPREKVFFHPRRTVAAVVTCGGLCPGLNNVIRSVFLELYHNYGVRRVLGIRYGYAGLNPRVGEEPWVLTPAMVEDIHQEGGTLLGSSRGPQPIGLMVDYLVANRVNILFCVGGDGTLRGARELAEEAMKRGVRLAVVGIPKTIDNDVMFMTRTFGVSTAMAVASEVLACAHAEAHSAYHGVGLVKIMGRHAGFVAASATLASQEVNFCLIPEVRFGLGGRNGFLGALERRLKARKHAVVAVAEGAGQDLLEGSEGGVDASGNRRLGDIGIFLKEQIVEGMRRRRAPVDVKYFDPSYLVRSVPANPDDAILCDDLARRAVHAGMAGKTNLVVGFLNGTYVHVPIELAVSEKRQVDPEGPLWNSVLASTGQPRRMV
jgi:6-phosphofructokinase 1